METTLSGTKRCSGKVWTMLTMHDVSVCALSAEAMGKRQGFPEPEPNVEQMVAQDSCI